MAWRWYEMTDKNEVITIPDKGLEAVSYTHLDVYKRQHITRL